MQRAKAKQAKRKERTGVKEMQSSNAKPKTKEKLQERALSDRAEARRKLVAARRTAS